MSKKVVFLAKFIDSGGVSAMMLELGKELKQNEWEVHLISGGQHGLHRFTKEAFEHESIEYIELPFFKQGIIGLLKLPFSLIKFLKIINRIRPNLLHVHWRSVSIYAKISEIFLNIPFVSTIHLNEIPSNFLYKFLSFWGKKVIVISRETSKFMFERFHIPYANQALIYNGVDDQKFKIPTFDEKIYSHKLFNIDERKFVICCLARLEKIKGHKIIIEAIDKLASEVKKNIMVIFGGEGLEEQALKAQIIEFKLQNNFLFLGHADSYSVLKTSNLFILMSYKEGFPVCIPEAMLSGVAVIRTPAEGAFDQIENNETGFIVDFDDSESLSRKIALLYYDRSLINYIIEKAYKKAKKCFTKDIMVHKTISLYNSII